MKVSSFYGLFGTMNLNVQTSPIYHSDFW